MCIENLMKKFVNFDDKRRQSQSENFNSFQKEVSQKLDAINSDIKEIKKENDNEKKNLRDQNTFLSKKLSEEENKYKLLDNQCKNLEEKCKKSETKCSELETKCSELETKCSELISFKEIAEPQLRGVNDSYGFKSLSEILAKLISVNTTMFNKLIEDIGIDNTVKNPDKNISNILKLVSYTQCQYFESFYDKFFIKYLKENKNIETISEREMVFYSYLEKMNGTKFNYPKVGEYICDSVISCKPVNDGATGDSKIKAIVVPGNIRKNALVIGG